VLLFLQHPHECTHLITEENSSDISARRRNDYINCLGVAKYDKTDNFLN
jgi:hypothetical protein